MTKKKLTAADIIDHDDAKVVAVDVPEWGGEVFLRVMTGTARDAFEADMAASAKTRLPDNFRARFLVGVLCDETGAPLFTDPAVLGRKSGSVLDRLFSIGQDINHMGEKAVADLGKGSASDQTAGSGSVSPSV